MTSIYNSQDRFYKTPYGAVRAGQAVTFRLAVPCDFGCTTPYLIWNRDGGEPVMQLLHKEDTRDGRDVFSCTLSFAQAGLYFYYFDLYTGYRKLYRGALGECIMTTGTGESYQLTVFEADFQTPAAVAGGVIYQIFPDRFCEGVKNKVMPFADRIYRPNKQGEPYFWPTEQADGHLNQDYFGGDLEGIRQKLPYLADLGVTLLYLNPVFEAHSNHRYNTADYRNIDPLLGTNEAFEELCWEAKRHGIGIILDGVFSHTGSDSIYFNRECRYNSFGAWQGEGSPFRSWYDFSPNYKCGYRSWWGFETLPEVNEHDPAYRNFICGKGGVIDYWMERGASGFRLDVADELPDDFIEDIRRAVKRHGEDKYLLGEVWEDATNKWSYGRRRTYLLGKGLDGVMNYPFKDAAIGFVKGEDARSVADRIVRICENYPAPALNATMNFLSTHDTVRAITAMAGESCEGRDRYWQSGRRLTPDQYERGRRMVVMGYALIFTLPGIPSIYYGDEIGMQGYKDPFNRAFFDWDSTENRIRPALQRLAALRKNCSAFADGEFHLLRAEDGVLEFERRGASAVAAVCLNRSPSTLTTQLLGQTVTVNPYDFAAITQSR